MRLQMRQCKYIFKNSDPPKDPGPTDQSRG